MENDSLRKGGNQDKGRDSDESLAVARLVDEIADGHGVTSTQVAVAWVLAQGYPFIPIAGARKVAQIEDTVGAAALALSAEDLRRLDEATAVSLGFPHDFLASAHVQDMVKGEEARHRLLPRPSR
jgi:aryl-alcohol dehydrogenase-like predicted oxidoreductase